jgi:hypothetical protein
VWRGSFCVMLFCLCSSIGRVAWLGSFVKICGGYTMIDDGNGMGGGYVCGMDVVVVVFP